MLPTNVCATTMTGKISNGINGTSANEQNKKKKKERNKPMQGKRYRLNTEQYKMLQTLYRYMPTTFSF